MPSTNYQATIKQVGPASNRGYMKAFDNRAAACRWMRETGRSLAADRLVAVGYELTRGRRVVLRGRYWPRPDGSTVAVAESDPNRAERETALHAALENYFRRAPRLRPLRELSPARARRAAAELNRRNEARRTHDVIGLSVNGDVSIRTVNG